MPRIRANASGDRCRDPIRKREHGNDRDGWDDGIRDAWGDAREAYDQDDVRDLQGHRDGRERHGHYGRFRDGRLHQGFYGRHPKRHHGREYLQSLCGYRYLRWDGCHWCGLRASHHVQRRWDGLRLQNYAKETLRGE